VILAFWIGIWLAYRYCYLVAEIKSGIPNRRDKASQKD